ncbi:hypothetical protein GCM10007918_56140 [Piscinibacter gummiphilus]|nr:hypothetical protein GCM10007918_56140 [Piscinibacter gummiphilus]
MASANAKVSRDQPRSIVMGCSHRPKPWRMPIDRVTIRPAQARTWPIGNDGGGEAEDFIPRL